MTEFLTQILDLVEKILTYVKEIDAATIISYVKDFIASIAG